MARREKDKKNIKYWSGVWTMGRVLLGKNITETVCTYSSKIKDRKSVILHLSVFL